MGVAARRLVVNAIMMITRRVRVLRVFFGSRLAIGFLRRLERRGVFSVVIPTATSWIIAATSVPLSRRVWSGWVVTRPLLLLSKPLLLSKLGASILKPHLGKKWDNETSDTEKYGEKNTGNNNRGRTSVHFNRQYESVTVTASSLPSHQLSSFAFMMMMMMILNKCHSYR